MSEPVESVRKRDARINSSQKKVLLQYLADNPNVYYQRVGNDFNLCDHTYFWENVKKSLNIFGPPRKTTQAWKKAWKDMRLRYKKGGIDIKQIIISLKSNPIVNTRHLTKRVSQIEANNEKVDISNLLDECGMSNSPYNSPNWSPLIDMDRSDYKCDLSRTLDVANELGMSNLSEKLKSEVKFRNLANGKTNKTEDNINCEEYYLSVEEVENPDDLNEVEITLKTDSDDIEEANLLKKEMDSQSVKRGKFESSHSRAGLDDILIELRSISRTQREQFVLQKNFINYQHLVMQQTLKVQKEMVKAQNILAESVKHFVDNISFNS